MSTAESWTIESRAIHPVGEDASARPEDDLAALYDTYAGLLYRYAISIVGSDEEAQDVVQEVFVGLLRRHQLGRIDHVREYLLCATRNQAYMSLRKRRRRGREVALDTWIDLTLPVFPECELAADISAALAQLPPEQREVITLRLMGELNFKEIAAILAIPLPTAVSRYRLAISKLRTFLSESDDHD